MRIRALIVLAAAAAGLLPTTAAARPAEETTTYRVDTLRAQWILPAAGENGIRVMAVYVYRRTNANTGAVTLTAVAGRGRCGNSNACGVFLSRHRVTEYEVDPAFATARVVVERGRWRHEVTFTPGAPYAFVPPVAQNPTLACKGGTVTTVYLTAKNASAEGRVYGQDVSTADEVDAQRESEKMIQTLEIEECP
jgi:hypothetical protein